ncbi:AraC family transcriptional regulator [Undibacterium sp. TJN25]|uniref:AraC family transcriptional regulator n=1 Tax=Undibacterium sp. TJN25 TaxID=3413056 RepID=UPI003BF14693
MLIDPFSEILKLVNAESLLTGGFAAGGTWAIRFPAPDKIKFAVVAKGGCWIRIEGEPEAVYAVAGDVLLLNAPRSFVLASDSATLPEASVNAMELFGKGNNYATVGDGKDFSYLGGHVLLDPSSGRLLADVLPPWIHIRAASSQATKLQWLVEQLVHERASTLPGASLVSAQLAQIMFIQILRAHLETSESFGAGWLRALGDHRVAPALRLMHSDPSRAWHLEELAEAVAMSRTSFALHFKKVVGVAPLSYLTQWRMHLAERALRTGDVSVAALAWSLGYTSESAFSTAFKRATGKAPKNYQLTARLASK